MAADFSGERAGTGDELMGVARERQRRQHVAEAVDAYVAAGRLFLEGQGDVEQAKIAFDNAAQLDPANVEVLFQRARIDAIRGRCREALAKFLTVVRASGQTHVQAMFEAGCMYQELGQRDQAVLAFRRVLDRDSGNLQALVNVAQRLQAMGMRPEALNHYMAAAETAFARAQYGTCRHLLGVIQSIDPLHAKARALLAELNTMDGNSAETHPEAATPSAAFDRAPRREALKPYADVSPAPVETLEAKVAELRAQRDRLQEELRSLAAAIAAEETELAALRLRRKASADALAVQQARTAAPSTNASSGATRGAGRRKAAASTKDAPSAEPPQPKSNAAGHEGRPPQRRRPRSDR